MLEQDSGSTMDLPDDPTLVPEPVTIRAAQSGDTTDMMEAKDARTKKGAAAENPTLAQRFRDWKRTFDENNAEWIESQRDSPLVRHWREKDKARRADDYEAYNRQRRLDYAAEIEESEGRPVREYRRDPEAQAAHATEQAKLRMRRHRENLSEEEKAVARARDAERKRAARARSKQAAASSEDNDGNQADETDH